MYFKILSGIYYQPPFYKEIEDQGGNFKSNINPGVQCRLFSPTIMSSGWWDKPFKLTTEAYYKKIDNHIPYYLDNVRIRYSCQNNARGYGNGLETPLFGEYVPGIDSWISASYVRVYEDIKGGGSHAQPSFNAGIYCLYRLRQ